MSVRNKRTVKETIELFRWYANEFQKDARKFEKLGMVKEMNFALGKVEAYEVAAFELEHNLEGYKS